VINAESPQPVRQVSENHQPQHGAKELGRPQHSGFLWRKTELWLQENQRAADHQEVVAVNELAKRHQQRRIPLPW
jgi:hypothetical protein